MSASKRVPGFSSKTNGFHFDNHFTPPCSYPSITLPVVGTIYSGDASKGICDGFAFSALDLFLYGPPLTPPTDTKPPAQGTTLFNYMTGRENDAWFSTGLANFWKGFQWIHTPSHDTGFDTPFGRVVTQRGLSWNTATEEWPAIKRDIDAGQPSPIWLVTTPGCPVTNLPQTIQALTNHHQVLAYGYTLDDANNLTLNIYDPQAPGSDTATIVLNLSNSEHTIDIKVPTVTWATVRGFFRSSYDHHDATSICAHQTAPPKAQIALQTVNGNTLTIVNGGGLGGPNTGPGSVPLHSDAMAQGPWETFTVEWVDDSHVALKTCTGRYLTAVNGGGIGGPNDATCPVHTDAKWVGPCEKLMWNYNPTTHQATIQVPDGRFLTAVNGGGFGGPNNTPIHTDAVSRGPWETFRIVYLQ